MPKQPPPFAEWLVMKMAGAPGGKMIAVDLRGTGEVRGRGRFWDCKQVLPCLLVPLRAARPAPIPPTVLQP